MLPNSLSKVLDRSRLRWRRCRRGMRKQPPPQGLRLVVFFTTLISSCVIIASGLSNERFKNSLIQNFANQKINQVLHSLENDTQDFAAWIETTEHLNNRNPNYYEDGYNQYSFDRTFFVATLNPKGDVYSSSTWDQERQKSVSLSPAQETELKSQIPWDTTLLKRMFLARFEGRPFLFSVQPVRAVDKNQPSPGYLVFVRALDADAASFKTSPTFNSAMGVISEFYGPTPKSRINPLAPIYIEVPLKALQGRVFMPLVIERLPRERIDSLILVAILLLASSTFFQVVKLRAFFQSRLYRHLQLKNHRKQQQSDRGLDNQRNQDSLTGLLSEYGFFRSISGQSGRYPDLVQAVAYIDLDHFAMINNGLGKEMGDEVLQVFAKCLQQYSHPSWALARISGDKFSCSLISTSVTALCTEVSGLSQHLNDLKLNLSTQTLNVTVSIGAQFTVDQDYVQAMHEAAIVCSVVKLEGGRGYQFHGDVKASTSSYLAIQHANQELITAIYDQRIELYGQHAWQLDRGPELPATYVELLCRIRHPETNKPFWSNNIVDAAQLCGSLQLLDQVVIKLAFKNISDVVRQVDGSQSHSGMIYAINITPDTLISSSFVEMLGLLVDDYGVSPQSLCLEITEQAALRSPALAVKAMKNLRRVGFRFALDDFGTGMTSLGYLRDLPLDYVKIDKSFIGKYPHDKASRLIVQFVVELGKEIGFQIIAEGVETLEQLLELQSAGVSIAQGYLITRPRPFGYDPANPVFFRSGQQTLGHIKL